MPFLFPRFLRRKPASSVWKRGSQRPGRNNSIQMQPETRVLKPKFSRSCSGLHILVAVKVRAAFAWADALMFLEPISVSRAGPSWSSVSLFNPDSWFKLTVAGDALRRTHSGGFYAYPHAAGINSDTKSRSLRAGNNYSVILNHCQHRYVRTPATPGTEDQLFAAL
jgi:hypothetical protein